MISLVLLAPVATAGCSVNTNQKGQEPSQEKIHMPVSMTADFANYKDLSVDFSPAIKPYVVERNLSNVTNTEMFQFSKETERMLVENGFVVVPSQYREFFMLYEINRYQPVPNFITTDSMLHNYHLFFAHLLREVEKEKLEPLLKELTSAMLAESEKQYKDLKGTKWENAALRNIGFFSVAGKLLNLKITVSDKVKTEVEEELRLIENRGGIQASPLLNMGQQLKGSDIQQEDYTQYIPRGHYNKDELLQSYFKAMMWYGRMTFRTQSEDETKSAILMTLALSRGDNGQKWDEIYQPTNFFVGKADDLSFLQYMSLLKKIYGADIELKGIASDDGKWRSFMEATSKMEPSVINSIPIFDEDIQPDREKAINGLRFMGQRFTLDAAVFQRLVYRDVKENSEGDIQCFLKHWISLLPWVQRKLMPS